MVERRGPFYISFVCCSPFFCLLTILVDSSILCLHDQVHDAALLEAVAKHGLGTGSAERIMTEAEMPFVAAYVAHVGVDAARAASPTAAAAPPSDE